MVTSAPESPLAGLIADAREIPQQFQPRDPAPDPRSSRNAANAERTPVQPSEPAVAAVAAG
ncbi:MAG: hypothetical protein WCB04_07830 [Mycobacteriales bacterium]